MCKYIIVLPVLVFTKSSHTILNFLINTTIYQQFHTNVHFLSDILYFFVNISTKNAARTKIKYSFAIYMNGAYQKCPNFLLKILGS